MRNNLDRRIKVILWDFDGVLIDSNSVRVAGFEEVLKEFPEHDVVELLKFHDKNGGLSRYVKFKYFFETIRREKITNKEIQYYADRFSSIMREKLCDANRLVPETTEFVRTYFDDVCMHIVSGSDQDELRYLCGELGISRYFNSILGSPTPKNSLVRKIISENLYESEGCVLIGDSINDYEAAVDNNIRFICYNNQKINHLTDSHLQLF